MSELLSIIDAGSTEHACIESNNLRWQFPIDGVWRGGEPLKLQPQMRPRPQRKISSGMESPEISLVIGVLGNDRGTLMTRIDALLWWTDPDRGTFILKRTTSNSSERRREVTRTGYELGTPEALASGGRIVPVTITCQSADPTWYDPSSVTVTGQFSGATSVELSLENSNVEAYIDSLIYSGAVDTPKLELGDWELEFDTDAAMVAGDVLTLVFDPNSNSFGATLLHSGAESSWTGRISTTSRWGLIPAGTNDATFSATSGDASITLQFTKRYKVLA